MLPPVLDTDVIRNVSDVISAADPSLEDAIDDVMNRHIGKVVRAVASQFKLDDDQAEELLARVGWRLELLPPD